MHNQQKDIKIKSDLKSKKIKLRVKVLFFLLFASIIVNISLFTSWPGKIIALATGDATFTEANENTVLTPGMWNGLLNEFIKTSKCDAGEILKKNAASGDSNDNDSWECVGGEYKMLAESSDWTEGARYTINSSGISVETDDTTDNYQTVSPIFYNWPSDKVTEIRFKANNAVHHYCVGGNGILDLSNMSNTSLVKCTQYNYKENSINTRKQINESANWIRLSINDTEKTKCENDFLNNPARGYDGQFSYRRRDAFCVYKYASEIKLRV